MHLKQLNSAGIPTQLNMILQGTLKHLSRLNFKGEVTQNITNFFLNLILLTNKQQELTIRQQHLTSMNWQFFRGTGFECDHQIEYGDNPVIQIGHMKQV